MKSLKKKLLSSSLIMMVALFPLAGCTGGDEGSKGEGDTTEPASTEPTDENFNKEGLPVVDEQITITVAGGYAARTGNDWNKKKMIQQLEKDTNIHANWQLTPSQGWSEKKNLLLASQNLPDVILGLSRTDIVKYGSQGTLIPLEGLIQKYAPNLTKWFEEHPKAKKLITAPDGHIYTLPRAYWANRTLIKSGALWINKKWLEKAGLDMPKTTEEFKHALEVFKKQDMNGNGDPNDEIPLSFVYGEKGGGLESAFGPWGVIDNGVIVRNDEVQFSKAQPGYKQGIKFFHSLYAEGLMDKTVITQKSNQFVAKLSSDPATVGAFYGWSPATLNHNEETRWDYAILVPPIKGPNGDQLIGATSRYYDKGAMAITSANEHPAATIRWADQVYKHDTSYKFALGPNRVKKQENGKWKLIVHPDDYTKGEWRTKESPVNDFIYTFDNEDELNLIQPELDHMRVNTTAFYKKEKPYMKPMYFPSMLFKKEENEKITRYETDIKTYARKMKAKWITKGGIEGEWDAYIEKLNKLGLQDMLGVYQGAYDRFKASGE